MTFSTAKRGDMEKQQMAERLAAVADGWQDFNRRSMIDSLRNLQEEVDEALWTSPEDWLGMHDELGDVLSQAMRVISAMGPRSRELVVALAEMKLHRRTVDPRVKDKPSERIAAVELARKLGFGA